MSMIEIRTHWIHEITYDMMDFAPIIALGVGLLMWGVGTLYLGRNS